MRSELFFLYDEVEKEGVDRMRLAFISDIHGNAVALEAVLEDISRKKVDKIYVLGDLAYRGPEPRRCLDLIRDLQTEVIKGNADEWIVRGVQKGEVPDSALDMMNKEREWTLKHLTETDVDNLRSLPTELSFSASDSLHLHAFHATPQDLFTVVPPDTEQDKLKEQLMSSSEAQLYLYAHIHHPYIRFVDGKCIVNLGSVGLPFDGLPKASYAMLDAEGDGFQVSIQRVAYDIEKVVQQYQKGGYPNADLMIQIIRNGARP